MVIMTALYIQAYYLFDLTGSQLESNLPLKVNHTLSLTHTRFRYLNETAFQIFELMLEQVKTFGATRMK